LIPVKEAMVSIELEIGLDAESVWTIWKTEKTLTSVGNRTTISRFPARR
jgi:hypothetical protein